jgi:hypothetical protein
MEWTREPGSFRDPSGFVFTHEGVLYRQVNAGFAEQYRRLIDSGLYDELVRDGLLVPHEEVDLPLHGLPPAHVILRPRTVPFISYPYEWCFGQYKAAALLTLDLQRRAIERGMVLRDASAYNVQFVAGRPAFIDTLSFGRYTEGEPWSAYRQFCRHFLNPLSLMAHVDPTCGQLTRVHLDGVPSDVTARLLPISTRFRVGLLTHVHLHARSGGSGPSQHVGSPKAGPSRRMGKTAMLGLVDSLRRTVEALAWKPPATLWSTYTEHASYSPAARDEKQRLVGEWLDLIRARSTLRTVWDLGANIGTYSLIAANRADLVIGFDLDPVAVEHHFRACNERHDTRVLPLVQDLANPSPRIGWHHAERRSLLDRGPANAAMALALVHHLAIGGNVPLPDIAALFHDLCQHLIVEFVPKEDSQVQRMLALGEGILHDYSQPRFEAAFASRFEVLQSRAITETVRTLYLMRRR